MTQLLRVDASIDPQSEEVARRLTNRFHLWMEQGTTCRDTLDELFERWAKDYVNRTRKPKADG